MKLVGLVTLALALGLNCAATGAQIDSIPWTDASITQLNKSDKTAVVAFLNRDRDSQVEAVHPYEIEQYRWIDLAGDGKLELLEATYWPAISATTIYWRESTGNFSNQTLTGDVNLNDGVKDLNGDGKKEIIVDSYLDPAGRRAAGSATPVWPQVYRLEGEKYMPVTKDFPGLYDFYEREVLPRLNTEIDKQRRTMPPDQDFVDNAVAALEMQRDKILRFLELDPQAGLSEARQWARSDDPDMINNAWCVFQDIPGHEADASAAKEALIQALQRRRANAQ